MRAIKFLLVVVLAAGMITFISCKKDDDGPNALTVVSITASGTDVTSGEDVTVDLNAATAAETVPINPVITITFSRDVDETTVTANTVSITDVSATIDVSGAEVTLTPEGELERGSDYVLNIGAVAATDGGEFTATTRSFGTGGRSPVVAPHEDATLAFWKFDGDASDETGTYNPTYEHNITYVEDRHGQASSTAMFDGDASIIEIADAVGLMSTNSWTISLWVNMDTTDNPNAAGTAPAGQFMFGYGAFYGFRVEANGRLANFNLTARWLIDNGVDEPFTRNEGLAFGGNGSYNETGGWRGHTWQSDWEATGGVAARLVNSWAHIVFTHDAPSKISSIYVNGELVKEQDYNLYPLPPDNPHPQGDCIGWQYSGEEPNVYQDMVFGFVHSRRGELWDDQSFGNYDSPTSNHYKGMMDDFRIIGAHYTAEDVADLYDAEAP